MIIIYLNDLIDVNFDLYEAIIINVKIFKIFKIVNKFDRIFKRKFKRYHLFENKVYIH